MSTVGLVDDHLQVRDSLQRQLDTREHLRPNQSPQPAAQGRDGDGADVTPLDFVGEGEQSGIDVLHPAFPLPMPLCGKIDDESRRGKLPGFKHEHLSRLNFLTLTGTRVRLEVFGKYIFELQRNAPTHDADAVDRVDQCFHIFTKDIARFVFDHWGLLGSP